MERLWWRELEGTHGIRRDDRSSWRQIRGDLKAAKRDPLIQQKRQLLASQRRGSIATLRDRFHRSHPWLMALTGQAPSPADRIAAFMDRKPPSKACPSA